MKKLVIAYSGGLDTSYCAVSLSKEYDVHAVSVNTGGFTKAEIGKIEDNAYKMGVSTYENIDAVATFYQKVVKYLIFGNVLKNSTYPLSVSAERIIQAIEIEENRFGFEPEITAKIARGNHRIYEVGISYSGRTYAEGKKIGWKDGVRAFYAILKYNVWHR